MRNLEFFNEIDVELLYFRLFFRKTSVNLNFIYSNLKGILTFLCVAFRVGICIKSNLFSCVVYVSCDAIMALLTLNLLNLT